MSNLSTTFDDILACARILIVRGGYNGFSYADIAKVVGIRNASIHHHFPSKSDLVRTLVARYRQEAEVGLAEMARRITDPAGRLRAYTGYWEACISDGSIPFCICALLAGQMPVLPEEVAIEVRQHFRMLEGWLTAVLTSGRDQGRLRLVGTAEAEARLFMATLHGAMLSARACSDPLMFGAIVRPMLERLMP